MASPPPPNANANHHLMSVPVLQQPLSSLPVASYRNFPISPNGNGSSDPTTTAMAMTMSVPTPSMTNSFFQTNASNPVDLLTAAVTSVTANATTTTSTSANATMLEAPLHGQSVKRGAHEDVDPLFDSLSADGASSPVKKHKISRERQLRINAASRRCRKRQKMEVKFLRKHVVELQNALKMQLAHLQEPQPMPKSVRHARIAHLSMLLDESIKKTEEMSNEIRRSTAAAAAATSSTGLVSTTPSAPTSPAWSDPVERNADSSSRDETSSDEVLCLSESKKRTLLDIAGFIKRNISLESRACIPEVISCLPIDIDGWQLRMSIDEKHYTTHLTKFFPVNYLDMFDFCWDKHVTKAKRPTRENRNEYRVTALSDDVAHVDAKLVGSWTSAVHGVPQLGYRSLVCSVREEADESQNARALICQQSVVDPKDLKDNHAVSWLFRRWLSFQPHEQDGVHGTLVESYRTGSYATGMRIYKGDKRYDDFCEHLIQRYIECNALLESFMAQDQRFQHLGLTQNHTLSDDQISELVMRDLLLF